MCGVCLLLTTAVTECDDGCDGAIVTPLPLQYSSLESILVIVVFPWGFTQAFPSCSSVERVITISHVFRELTQSN